MCVVKEKRVEANVETVSKLLGGNNMNSEKGRELADIIFVLRELKCTEDEIKSVVLTYLN